MASTFSLFGEEGHSANKNAEFSYLTIKMISPSGE